MENFSITLKQNQNIYFTSDMHFMHRNVIQFCDRPFANTKEMAHALVENWNARVKPDDYIFVLGDTFWFNSRHETLKWISKLNGRKYFILGNHDTAKQYELCLKKMANFHLLPDVSVLFVNFQPNDERIEQIGRKSLSICLSHYPLACYSHSDKGRYHFFGHIHSRKQQPMVEFGKPVALCNRLCMDVGSDRHDYAPVELREVLKEIENYTYWECHELHPIDMMPG